MASIIDIILRIKNDGGAVITQAVNDLLDLKKAAEGLSSSGGAEQLALELEKVEASSNKGKEGLKELGEEAEGVGDGLNEVTTNADGATGALGEVANASTAATSGVETIVEGVRSLVAAFAALLALGTLKKWADAAAGTQVAGTVLGVVAKNAGITSTAVGEADIAIQKMGITAKASADSLTKFIQAGLAGLDGSSLGKAKELARAAQDLAVVSGQNSSDTFSRMIVNIQQMDSMGMRFMGITVNREVAEQKYAAAVGKTVSALTEAEKKQAFMNTTLEEAKKLQGTYEAAMGDTAKQLTTLPRLYEELYVALGQQLQPSYSALVMTLQEFLKESKAVVLEMNKQSDGGRSLGESVRVVAGAVKDSIFWLVKHKEAVLFVVEAWLAFKVIGVLGGFLTTMVTSIQGVTSALLSMQLAMRSAQAAGIGLTATLSTGLGLQAVVASFGAIGTMGPQIPSVLRGITTALGAMGTAIVGLVRFAGPIAFLAVTVYQLYDAFFRTPTKEALGASAIADAKKQIITDIDELIEAKKEYEEVNKRIATAPAGADTSADEFRKRELEGIQKVAREKIDVTAKSLDMDKKATEARINLREGELKVNQQVARIEANIAATEMMHVNLGGVDKDGKTQVSKVIEDGNLLKNAYQDVMAMLVDTKETEDQKLSRVTASTGLSPKMLVEEAAKAEMGIQQYMDKMYPKPTMISRWDDMAVAIASSGTAGRKAFSIISTEFDKFVASAKSPQDIAEALKAVADMATLIPARVKAAQETLEFRGSKASIDQLNQALEGFDAKLKTIRSSMETYTMLSRDASVNDNKWALMMAQLQGSFKGFGQSLYSVNSDISNFEGQIGKSTYAAAGANGRASIALFKDTSNEVAKLANEQANQEVAIAIEKYNREEALLKASLVRREEVLKEQPKSSGESEDARGYQEQLEIYTAAQNRMKALTAEGIKDKHDARQIQLDILRISVEEQSQVAIAAEQALVAKTKEFQQVGAAGGFSVTGSADLGAFQKEIADKKAISESANNSLNDLIRQQKAVEADLTKEGAGKVTDVTRAQYAEQEVIARTAKSKMDSLAKSVGITEDQNTANAKLALDRDTNQKSLENAKQLYSTLKSLREQYLAAYKASLEKIQSLEKEIFNMQEGKDKDLRDLKRKGMSEEEVQADKLKEYYELIAKAQEATQQGAYDKAKEYAMSAKGIATSLEGVDPTKQASMVSEAWDVATEAVSKNKEETEKTAAAQKKSMDALATAMTEVSSTIKGLTDGEVKAVMIGVDDKSLQEALAKVKDAFETMQVSVKVNSTTTGVDGYAVGGLIRGPGTPTSDSILAAVSTDEFIHKAQAVRHYGADFMYAINSMSLPRELVRTLLGGGIPQFSIGGLAGALRSSFSIPTPRFNPQGLLSASTQATEASVMKHELNITREGKKVGRVVGSRESIHNLVSMLQEVSRGT